MMLHLVIEIWNFLPDAARYAAGAEWPYIVYIMRFLAAAAGLTYYEDMSIGG